MSAPTIELAAGHGNLATQAPSARSANLAQGQSVSDAQAHAALGAHSPGRAMAEATPHDLPPGQDTTPPQAMPESAASAPAPAGAQTDDGGQVLPATQALSASVVTIPDRPAIAETQPIPTSLADPTLALAADVLDDLEGVKIANQNRLRALTRDEADVDGEVRGFGLDESHPDVARLAALVTLLERAEHEAVLNLQRVMRRHPLGPWVKAQRGIGDKQAARLLAKIGDPYINLNTGQPRTVSALWAYCGLHVLPSGHDGPDAHTQRASGDSTSGGDPGHSALDAQPSSAGVAARRQKGQKANWSTDAKTRAWLIVQSCMKQLDAACKTDTGIAEHVESCTCSPYRVAIDERRAHTAITHPEWTPGHSLNDAMRIASKRLLRDLWREARRIHGVTEGQPN